MKKISTTKGLSIEEQKRDFFIGREQILDELNNLLRASESKYSVVMLAGIGGIGKSAILDFFAAKCRTENSIPVSIVDGELYDSEISILRKIARDLQKLVSMQSFKKGIRRYLEIQANLKRQDEISSQVIDAISRSVGIGLQFAPQPFQTIGQETVQSTLQAIHRLLKPSDAELLLTPQIELTNLLIQDLNQYAATQKLVLIFDTCDLFSDSVYSWLQNSFVPNLSSNIVFIMSGRQLPISEWMLQWGENIKVIQLELLSNREAMQYLNQRGCRSTQLIQELVEFAKGLPLALAVSYDLVLRFNIYSFRESPQWHEATRILIGIFMQETDNPILEMALQVCAIMQSFNKTALTYVVGTDIAALFNSIVELSFVRIQKEGFSLHELVREYIITDLEWQDPKKLQELHHKVADYFAQEIERTGEDWFRMNRQRLHHLLRANESEGIILLDDLIGKLLQFRYFGQLDICDYLIREAMSYNFNDSKNRVHVYLLIAEISMYQTKFDRAQLYYQEILRESCLDLQTRGRVEFGYGEVLFRQNKSSEGREHFFINLDILNETKNIKTIQYAQVLHSIGDTYRMQGDFEQAMHYYMVSLDLAYELEAWFRVGDTLHMIATSYRILLGDHNQALTYLDKAINIIERTGNESAIGWIYIHKAYIHCMQNMLDLAHEELNFGYELIKKYRIPIYYGWAQTALGYYLYKKGVYSSAKENLLRGIEFFKKGNAYYHKAFALLHVCEIIYKEQDKELFYQYFNELIEWTKKYGYDDLLCETLLLQVKFLAGEENYLQAAKVSAQAGVMARKFNNYKYAWFENTVMEIVQDINIRKGHQAAIEYLLLTKEHLHELGIESLFTPTCLS